MLLSPWKINIYWNIHQEKKYILKKIDMKKVTKLIWKKVYWFTKNVSIFYATYFMQRMKQKTISNTYHSNSPASKWIFIQIFAGEKILVSNGSLRSKEWYFTRYQALFCGSRPHIVRWLKKIDDFIAVRIQSSAEHNGRNFHWIETIFFFNRFV